MALLCQGKILDLRPQNRLKGRPTSSRRNYILGRKVDMSLKQQYTWLDFLKEYPENKEKKTKRTSSEGKKAFEAAFKAHAKKFLETQVTSFEKVVGRVAGKREALVKRLKDSRKAGRRANMKIAITKIGKADHAIAALKKQIEDTKAKQKKI